jgi:hypothetical protein
LGKEIQLKKPKRIARAILLLVAGGILSCILLGAVAYFSNQKLPAGPIVTDQIDPLDKARLAETLHLKTELGESVWPGWGQMEIPVLLWHQGNNFLIGVQEPPPNWEEVPNDAFLGEIYYRNLEIDPQNFAMLIGEEWVASMATKGETDLFLRQVFQELLPSPIDQFIPYRLLIQPSEVQISAVLHESFHVFQVRVSPKNFEQAEDVYPDGDRYWSLDEHMGNAWKTEIELLIKALNAPIEGDAIASARQFLDQRDQRRREFALDTALIDYERRFEWLEGLAKYVELAVWEQASQTPNYHPVSGMSADPDFKGYDTYESHWDREIGQTKSQAKKAGDVRFYYTGMLQARLLDRLMPGWKTRVMEEDVFLEDLLREAVFR